MPLALTAVGASSYDELVGKVKRETTEEQASMFNRMALENNQETWNGKGGQTLEKTQTIVVTLDAPQAALLQPFVRLAKMERGADGYICDRNGKNVKNKKGNFVAGFSGYSSVHSTAPPKIRDAEQAHNIIALQPWPDWKEFLPSEALECLPSDTQEAKQFANNFEDMIMEIMETKFKAAAVPWHPKYCIIYMHILDQACPSARFTWHRDTEEDLRTARVYYSMVLLLDDDGGDAKVAAMRIAGAVKMATYSRVGSGHIFDSALYHNTQPLPGAGGLKIGIFVGLRL
jgi:hypothetical protein